MKPRVKLAESPLPGWGKMALVAHDGAYSISFNGQELMHSKASFSEYRMGRICSGESIASDRARILIGGLGLGYTLKGALEVAGPGWHIVVAELLPEVVAWNHEHLAQLNGRLLQDSRVQVVEVDVADWIRGAPAESLDSVLLDVDNGPVAMVSAGNQSLYSVAGIRSVHRALKPGGRAVFWSAGPDAGFEARLQNRGFRVSLFSEKRHASASRPAVTLFVADKL